VQRGKITRAAIRTARSTPNQNLVNSTSKTKKELIAPYDVYLPAMFLNV